MLGLSQPGRTRGFVRVSPPNRRVTDRARTRDLRDHNPSRGVTATYHRVTQTPIHRGILALSASIACRYSPPFTTPTAATTAAISLLHVPRGDERTRTADLLIGSELTYLSPFTAPTVDLAFQAISTARCSEIDEKREDRVSELEKVIREATVASSGGSARRSVREDQGPTL